MKKDIQILCQGYVWDDSIDIQDCNFFSGETYTTIGDKIDLTEFMSVNTKLKISREIDQAIEDSDKPALYFVAGDIELELLDSISLAAITSGAFDYLHSYFYFYETSAYYDRVKFRVEIYYQGVLKAKGTIVRESIEESYSADDSNKTLKLSIVLYEKEFRDYYSTVDLPTITFTETKASGAKYLYLVDVLEALFPSVVVTIPEQGIKDWRVSENAEMYIASTGGILYYNRCGYKQIQLSGENSFEFLSKLCMSMGWVFMLDAVGTDILLVIMNRNTFDASVTRVQVSTDMVLEVSSSRMKDTRTYDYILINNGTMIGGDNCFPNGHTIQLDHRGERQVIITDKQQINNYPYHFSSVTKTFAAYSFVSASGDKFTKYHNETTEDYLYDYFIYTSSSANYKRLYYTQKNKTLFIHGGDNSLCKRRIQLTDHAHADYYDGETPLDDYDLVFTGNYGECLYQEFTSGGTTAYHYTDYSLGTAYHSIAANQLKLNYEKYLNRENSRLILDCTLNMFELSPLKILQFVEPIELPFSSSLNYEWLVSSIEADPETDTTKFKLIGSK